MTVSPLALTFACALTVLPITAVLADPAPARTYPVQAQGDAIEELERKADELSETARRTIEEFVNLVGPMLTRLSRLIEGLPVYDAPEVLPNGDIIIRRKHEPVVPGDTDEDGLTET